MDRMGIDIQRLAGAAADHLTGPSRAGRRSLAHGNDRLAEIVAKCRPLRGAGHRAAAERRAGVIELERCVEQLGLRGVEIIPTSRGRRLTDPSLNLDRFFAQGPRGELDIVIFNATRSFHAGDRLMDTTR